jgi:tetratricopeptide (TPR) repeat protein
MISPRRKLMAVRSQEFDPSYRSRVLSRHQSPHTSWRNWGDHPFGFAISLAAGIIVVFGFFTGAASLPAFWRSITSDPAAETKNPAAEQHIAQGDEYFRNNDYKRAIFEYSNGIKVDSSHAQYYHKRGNAYVREGKYDEAISDLTNAVNLNTNSADVYIDRAFAYFKRGDPQSAINDLNRALNLNSDNPIIYRDLGDNFLILKKYEQSILYYRKCVAHSSDEVVQLNCIHRELEAGEKWLEAQKPAALVISAWPAQSLPTAQAPVEPVSP